MKLAILLGTVFMYTVFTMPLEVGSTCILYMYLGNICSLRVALFSMRIVFSDQTILDICPASARSTGVHVNTAYVV